MSLVSFGLYTLYTFRYVLFVSFLASMLLILLVRSIRFESLATKCKISNKDIHNIHNMNTKIIDDYVRFMKICIKKSRIYDMYTRVYADKVFSKQRLKLLIYRILFDRNTLNIDDYSIDNKYPYVTKSINQLVTNYSNLYILDSTHNTIDNNTNKIYGNYVFSTDDMYTILMNNYKIKNKMSSLTQDYELVKYSNINMITNIPDNTNNIDTLNIYFDIDTDLSNDTNMIILHDIYYRCTINNTKFNIYDIVQDIVNSMIVIDYVSIDKIVLYLNNELTILAPILFQLLSKYDYSDSIEYVLTNPICYPVNFHENIHTMLRGISCKSNGIIDLISTLSLFELYVNIIAPDNTISLVNNGIDYNAHKLFSKDTTVLLTDNYTMYLRKSTVSFLKSYTNVHIKYI